ncbi:hypothetical protein MKW92_035583 [Papaver armeniacum]|nr:hypothetical protein MKW92_035583 [Papaver armeniacum]
MATNTSTISSTSTQFLLHHSSLFSPLNTSLLLDSQLTPSKSTKSYFNLSLNRFRNPSIVPVVKAQTTPEICTGFIGSEDNFVAKVKPEPVVSKEQVIFISK